MTQKLIFETIGLVNTCKFCKSAIQESFYFCPNCGKKIKEPPFKFSLGKSITIIVAAFLIPPFGIIPGIKYFLKDDRRAQFVGLVTIAVTIIATGLFIVVTARVINYYKDVSSQILQIQGNLNANQPGAEENLINQVQLLK